MKKIAVAGLLIAMMSVASAQVYVGGNIGQGHANVDCDGLISCDRTDTGYKLYAGYQITPGIAVEGAYVSFGKAQAKARYGNVLVNAELKSNGVLLAAALRHGFTPEFSVVGRLGLSFLSTETKAWSGAVNASSTSDSVKPYLGLGAEFAMTKSLRATVAADFTEAEDEDSSGRVRLLSVGLQYNF